MKEVFERERRKLSAQKFNERQKRRGFDKVQATAISSAVAALAVLLPKKAKAEEAGSATPQSLGTPFSQEINDFIFTSSPELRPQLVPEIAKNEFKMTLGPVSDYADVYATSFQIQDDIGNNGVVIQQMGTLSPVSEASNPTVNETSYLEIDRGDNQITKILNEGSIYVDGKVKWDGWYPETCNSQSKYFNIFHPSRNKDELKIVANKFAFASCGSVYRVPLDANNYCEAKIPDSQEKFSCVSSAPETKELLAVKRYEALTDTRPGYLIARKSDGALLHLQRSTDGTWTKENPQKSTSDFAEWDKPLAMLERETPNEREVTILVTNYYDPDSLGYDQALKALVLEQQPSSTPENPVWKEVPVTMTQDPTINPEELDSDGDGVKNGVDNCPSAKNPDQFDLNNDGYGDACASADCKDSGGYPWEEGISTTTNSSGLTVCKSDLVSGFSAYVMADQSMIHSDKDVVLDSAGNISAQSGQTLVYIHTQKAGTEALPAKKMIFPAGNSLELEIYSTEKLDGTPGTGVLNYIDFLGQPVEVKFEGQTNWKSEGVIVGGELGVEGSYYKAIVGNENVVVGCPPVCGAELPVTQPEPVAEPAIPAVENAVESAPTAELVTQAEKPVQSEPIVAEPPPAFAEPMPDIYETPDAEVETAEETGVVVIPQPEPAPDVAQDTAQSFDTSQSPDTPQTLDSQPDTLLPPADTPQQSEPAPDSAPAPETPNQPDGVPESSNPDIPQSADTAPDTHPISTPDASLDSAVLKDTAEKPIPKEKSEGSGEGGGGGCSLISEPAHYPYLNLKQTIEVNPLSAVMAAAVVARAVLMVRKAVQRKI